jgi:phospholipase C
MFCDKQPLALDVPSVMNPLPNFTTVHDDDQLNQIRSTKEFNASLKVGTLPTVSWVIPEYGDSDHPGNSIQAGQNYVTTLINAIMQSPEWENTVILLAWDDWGGFYDHVVPPTVDANGYGMRVPALLLSPFAKKGMVDHQTLSFDAYLKFIEDLYLNGERIDPTTDGRPDSRPTVRENAPELGNLLDELDFSQAPLQPLILSPNPTPGPASIPGS